MDEKNLPVTPNPALIIPLGWQSISNISSTLEIYFRSDPRRSIMTQVAAPVNVGSEIENENTGFDVLTYEQISNMEINVNTLPEFSLNELYSNWSKIKNRFEYTWHQLRSHESILEAGLSVEKTPNINIVILADLWDQNACFSLLPILYELKNLTEFSSQTMIQVLLTTARFPSESKTEIQKARISKLLTEIEHRILPEKLLVDDPILSALNLPNSLSLDNIRFVIFDTVKESEVTVSTREELNAITSSYILTSLNGNAAEALTQSLSYDLINNNRPFFAGGGSSSIIFNPDPVVEYCSSRLGSEYLLREYWPTSGDDKSLVNELLIRAHASTQNDTSWVNRLISRTIFSLVQVDNHWDVVYSLDDLILESPHADEISQCSWIEQITKYIEELSNVKIPAVNKEIEATKELVQNEISLKQMEYIDDLLQQVEIHPNIVFNGRISLETWKLELQYQIECNDKLLSTLPLDEDMINAYKNTINDIDGALKTFPEIPIIYKFIPKWKIRDLCLKLYSALKLRNNYLQLDKALQNAKESIKLQAVTPVKRNLLTIINSYINNQIVNIDKAISSFEDLDETLKSVQSDFANAFPKYIPGVTYVEGYQYFQEFLGDEDFCKDCFELYAPKDETIRLNLVEKYQFLKDWQIKNKQELFDIFKEYARNAFSSIRNLRIEEVLRRTKGKDVPDTQVTNIVHTISTADLCLIKPNWDYCQNSGGASAQIALIDTDKNPYLHSLISELWKDWIVIQTNDSYYYTFAKIKTQIPILAIDFLIKPGELSWKSLSKEERIQADIFPGESITNPRVIVTKLDGEDGEIVQKIFRWTFEPKGVDSTIEQVIKLNINRKRYSEYKSKARLVTSYNTYAEEEMTEIRDLSRAFEKLHSEHNWSTYNQAFNILTFVQSCIPYSFDKDTTTQTDWPRYPIETLMDGTGDCEDVAILCSAILARLGFSSALFLYPGHLAFGVQASDALKGNYVYDEQNKRRYYYGEATAKGWRLGEIPVSYRDNPPIEIFPISIGVSDT